MSALQFIDSNVVTDRMNDNQAANMQQLQVANNFMDSRDRRVQAANLDKAQRIAAMAGVPQFSQTTQQPTSLASVAPAQQTDPTTMPPGEANLPQSPLQGVTALPQAKASFSPDITENWKIRAGNEIKDPVERARYFETLKKPVQAVTDQQSILPQQPQQVAQIDPYYAKAQSALEQVSAMEGGGQAAMQLSANMQKRQDAAHAAALHALGKADYQTAQMLNQRHGLGLDNIFNNPQALQVASSLAASLPTKLEPAQALAYQEAAASAFGDVFSKTKNYQEAMRQAGAAGITAAKNARPRGDKFLTTPDGFFDPASGQYLTETGTGERPMPTDRQLNFSDRYKVGNDLSKSVQSKFTSHGKLYALMRDGSNKPVLDENGNHLSSEQADKLTGQIFIKGMGDIIHPITVEAARDRANSIVGGKPNSAAPSAVGEKTVIKGVDGQLRMQ